MSWLFRDNTMCTVFLKKIPHVLCVHKSLFSYSYIWDIVITKGGKEPSAPPRGPWKKDGIKIS